MSINTSTHFGAVEPIVRKHYGLEKNKYKPEFSQIFEVSTGKEAVRHSMEHGGPGMLSLKPENATVGSLTMRQGPDLTHTWAIYAGKIDISYELAKDTKVSAIKSVASSLGRSVALTPEYLAAQFLDRAFNSSYPATGDGKELCATDHLIIGTNASTGSNELSTPAALEETALEDIMTQLMTTAGPDGMIVKVMPKKLVVPAALANRAKKLATSDKTLGSANNDPSVVKSSESGISPMVFRYLSSATRYFVTTDYSNGLFWEWDIKEQFTEDNSPTIFNKTYVGFFRARWGCDDWRGIFGVNAS